MIVARSTASVGGTEAAVVGAAMATDGLHFVEKREARASGSGWMVSARVFGEAEVAPDAAGRAAAAF